MTCDRASRHAGSTELSLGASTAIPVPLMWKPARKRPYDSLDSRNERRQRVYVSTGLCRNMTYLIDSIFVGSPGLVAEVITLEDIAWEQSGSSFDDIGTNIFLREGHCPGIVAETKS